MKKCLLLIDVQNGFVSEETGHVLPRLEQLLSSFSEGPIVAFRFINPGNNAFVNLLRWNRLRERPETDLIPAIEARADRVFQKTLYSACTPQLMDFLAKEQIREVLLAGIDTDCCVLKTAVDLFEHNFRPVVLSHYCASNGGAESHEAALRVLSRTIGGEQIHSGRYPAQARTAL